MGNPERANAEEIRKRIHFDRPADAAPLATGEPGRQGQDGLAHCICSIPLPVRVLPANRVSPDVRNFNLGQTMYNYDFFNRNDGVDAMQAANGNPQLSTPDAAEVFQGKA